MEILRPFLGVHGANVVAVLFYHTEAGCNGLSCPPYDPEKELACAVCTK